MADLFHLPYGSIAKQVNHELFSSRPHVARRVLSIQSVELVLTVP
jgi:hypothetical protein